ncbi:type II toxin-antitoxin system VapC family toxin [Neisseria sp.]|uniref:type II toxin-antitoxin system VapC family toxin n=1 Tax=Neisseria sp. TaxID=192066 RepID=UPI0026DB69B8|nr:type II toxin-antitoxin system VapC family toxin [Neisseria sp.]MDO4906706.1 type II toxin-antitoxin system VapC family toxin [Neisseria sp.]
MRKILLDTHVVLWWLLDDGKLGENARKLIENSNNLIFVSAASIWEISIKLNKGLLKLPEEFFEIIGQEDFERLPIDFFHAKQAGLLPAIHQDPFDRMLIAQTQAEGLELMTVDGYIPQYGIRVIDAGR